MIITHRTPTRSLTRKVLRGKATNSLKNLRGFALLKIFQRGPGGNASNDQR